MTEKKPFTMKRTEQAASEIDAARADDFIQRGGEPEVTKTFRLPERLAHKLKVYAATHKVKEKELILRILDEWFADKEA
jgi:hypothetical protein